MDSLIPALSKGVELGGLPSPASENQRATMENLVSGPKCTADTWTADTLISALKKRADSFIPRLKYIYWKDKINTPGGVGHTEEGGRRACAGLPTAAGPGVPSPGGGAKTAWATGAQPGPGGRPGSLSLLLGCWRSPRLRRAAIKRRKKLAEEQAEKAKASL